PRRSTGHIRRLRSRVCPSRSSESVLRDRRQRVDVQVCLGGGLRPPSEPPPQNRLRRQSRRSKRAIRFKPAPHTDSQGNLDRPDGQRFATAGNVSTPRYASEGGCAPLPNLPLRIGCAGKAGARNARSDSSPLPTPTRKATSTGQTVSAS